MHVSVCRILSIFLLFTIAACGQQNPAEGKVVVAEPASICFSRQESSSAIEISISSACASSSCTEVLERHGLLLIDRDRFVIEGTSHFVLRDLSKPNMGCTADCGGAGSIAYEVDDLAAGPYTIMIDGLPFGHVTLPLPASNYVCVDRPVPGADPTQEPTPKISPEGTSNEGAETSPIATPMLTATLPPNP